MTQNRTAAVATALLGPLLLAGCGIKATGVIESGEPAKVFVPRRSPAASLYFLTQQDALVAVNRDAIESSTPEIVLAWLLKGPNEKERAAGLRSAIPPLGEGEAPAEVSVTPTAERGFDVRLPFKIGKLPEMARQQVICTVVASQSSSGATVVLRGTDKSLPAGECGFGL
ncbi:hypothetical protein OG625_07340 [Streptomyces sp. NBC_01351]|uniref:hypothetical protein n=1 Tax=Streptomyces sp. NBC_01351 TaxID=2903833 RepID=UPI002E33AFAC|nr:hypothetical protein [Streptomyces sp. NBC_01351]